MVLRPLGDLVTAVHRFVEDHPHELVGEGQLGHRQPHFGGGLDLGGQAVGGADNEAEGTALRRDRLQLAGEVGGGHLLALYAESYGEGAGRDGGEDGFGFL